MIKLPKFRKQNLKSKKIVPIITGAVFFITIAILIIPLWPKVANSINRYDPNSIDYPVSFPDGKIVSKNNKEIPKENRLVIPKADVDSEILEGDSLDVLTTKEGVWREPKSGNPETPGNMVIAGHRFQYIPPNTNTFYNLEEVTNGDKVVVFWKGKTYIYEVYKTLTVTPDQTEVRNKNPDVPNEITIYTCTPLYTSEKRFVVKAKLIL